MARVYLEVNEVESLEKAATNLRDRLLIRILFHLGCRISEALAITVQDIDFNCSTITILHLKSRVRLACPKCGARMSKTHRFCPACGAKVEKALTQEHEHRRIRTLPIDSDTLEMIRDYIRRGGPVPRGGSMLIFGINRHRAWWVIRDCAERAGLPELVNPETGKVHGVSPHRLRDAFAVHAVKLDDSGDGLRLLQEHLGHASFNTTARYRKVAGEEHPEWFDRIVVGDGTLPVIPAGIQPYPPVENPDEINTEIVAPFAFIPPEQPPFYDEDGNPLLPGHPSQSFGQWMEYSMTAASFHPAEVVEAMTYFDVPPEEEAAYDAPFPSRVYMAGPRVFPSLVNDLPGVNEDAWAGLTEYEKPFLTIWASNDPGNLGRQETQDNLINNIPGAVGQPHTRLPEASHFLQDDQGAEIARLMVEFIAANPP